MQGYKTKQLEGRTELRELEQLHRSLSQTQLSFSHLPTTFQITLLSDNPKNFRKKSTQRRKCTLPFYQCKITPSVGFPGGLSGKKFACNAGDPGLIPGLGRSPGEGNGNPLQYSCLENPWTEEPGRLQSVGCKVGHN